MEVFGNLDKSNFRGVDNQNLVSISIGKLKCEEAFEKPSVRSEKHGRRYEVQGGFCLLKSCLTLCDPMDCNLLGSSVYGILQARILEWVAISSSRGYSPPSDQNSISCISCIG